MIYNLYLAAILPANNLQPGTLLPDNILSTLYSFANEAHKMDGLRKGNKTLLWALLQVTDKRGNLMDVVTDAVRILKEGGKDLRVVVKKYDPAEQSEVKEGQAKMDEKKGEEKML
jgi:hypothetical protein